MFGIEFSHHRTNPTCPGDTNRLTDRTNGIVIPDELDRLYHRNPGERTDLDRARGHLVLGIAQLFVAGMLVLIPFTHVLWVLLVILVCMGFAGGFINTGGNILMT